MASRLDHAIEDLEQLVANLHLVTPEAISAWASSYSDRDMLHAIHVLLQKNRRQEQLLLELLQAA